MQSWIGVYRPPEFLTLTLQLMIQKGADSIVEILESILKGLIGTKESVAYGLHRHVILNVTEIVFTLRQYIFSPVNSVMMPMSRNCLDVANHSHDATIALSDLYWCYQQWYAFVPPLRWGCPVGRYVAPRKLPQKLKRREVRRVPWRKSSKNNNDSQKFSCFNARKRKSLLSIRTKNTNIWHFVRIKGAFFRMTS